MSGSWDIYLAYYSGSMKYLTKYLIIYITQIFHKNISRKYLTKYLTKIFCEIFLWDIFMRFFCEIFFKDIFARFFSIICKYVKGTNVKYLNDMTQWEVEHNMFRELTHLAKKNTAKYAEKHKNFCLLSAVCCQLGCFEEEKNLDIFVRCIWVFSHLWWTRISQLTNVACWPLTE